MRKWIMGLLLGATVVGGPALARDDWRDYRRDRWEEQRDYRNQARWERRQLARRDRDYYRDRRSMAARNGWYGRNGRYYSDYNRCRKDSNVEGTAIGAIGGGVLGNVIAGRGDKTEGTIIGAAVGGLIGNRIDAGEGRRRCY